MKICVTTGELLKIAKRCVETGESCYGCVLTEFCTGYGDLETLCQIENVESEIVMKVNPAPAMPERMPDPAADVGVEEDRPQACAPKIGGGRADGGRNGG